MIIPAYVGWCASNDAQLNNLNGKGIPPAEYEISIKHCVRTVVRSPCTGFYVGAIMSELRV